MRYLILALCVLILAVPGFAATETIYSNGSATVAIPAGQYINVFCAGSAKVYALAGYPNLPQQWVLETNGAVDGEEVSFGPYTYATQVRIDTSVEPALYSVGSRDVAIPVIRSNPAANARAQFAPIAKTTAVALTGPELMTGIVTATHSEGSTVAYTLPTGTLMDTASGLSINEGFEWTLINLSAAAADTITLTASSGHTIVGIAVVQSAHASTGYLYGASAKFFTRKTAANTFITYRLN